MPNSVGAVPGLQNKLRLQLSVCDAEPWPALAISADAFINGERVPVAQLKPERGAFICRSGTLSLDSLDALIVRTLLQLPHTGEAFRAGTREFATMLALLRQHSDACTVEET